MPDPRNDRPRIDDYVVEPGTNTELFEGEVRECLPANPAHSMQQGAVAILLGAYRARGYLIDIDLLTRQSRMNNFASDVCIRQRGLDPKTGGRYLEELAFEIKATQRPGDLKKRARIMAECGVRRVFAIPVKGGDGGDDLVAGPLLEWQRERDDWVEHAADAKLVDRCFDRPLPVAALLTAVTDDESLQRAVLTSESPLMMERDQTLVQRGEKQGELSGVRRSILALLAHNGAIRGIDGERARAYVDACDDERVLLRWLTRAGHARDLEAVFGDSPADDQPLHEPS